MFGCHAIYLEEKIMLILRKKENFQRDNGVWVATTHIHHQSLKNDFPSLRPIGIFGIKDSAWQNLPEEAADFEESVMNVCEKILKNDIRIGKVPSKKKVRSKPSDKKI